MISSCIKIYNYAQRITFFRVNVVKSNLALHEIFSKSIYSTEKNFKNVKHNVPMASNSYVYYTSQQACKMHFFLFYFDGKILVVNNSNSVQ